MECNVLSLPVTRVTVLEDRAQVERGGNMDVTKGTQRIRIQPVSPTVVDRSLKVELVGATLCDASVVRRWKKKPPGGLPADASRLRRVVHDLENKIEEAAHEAQRHHARQELAKCAHSDLLRSIAHATGAGLVNVEAWKNQLATVREQLAQVGEQARQVQARNRKLQERLAEARRMIAQSEQPEDDFEVAIELVVEAVESGNIPVKVGYITPCAVWRPAYRASLLAAPDGTESVHMECEAFVWQNTGEPWNDVELFLSTARPTLGASPPTLLDDELRLRDKSAQEKRVVEVSIREETIQTTGEGGGGASREMPGLDDGGQVQLLALPVKVSIPSDGRPHRVHLSWFDSPARTELYCAPEHSPLAYLTARFVNRANHVMLAGPVDLVRQSGFMGRAQMRFAAAGEMVRLPFGSEDHLRVVRAVEEKQDEARITGRRTTHRNVKLFISNASGLDANLVVEERIPVSEVKEVEVNVITKECKPAPGTVSKDGIARFEVALPPRQQKDVVFAYEVSAAGKVMGL